MGSSNKKTILLSKASHRQLSRLAGERGQTLRELVQELCARSRHRTPDRSGRKTAQSDDEPQDRWE
jgi:hypothetical protein